MKKTISFMMSMAQLACSALAAGNFVHDSESVAYLNPGAAISSGSLVDLGDRYGVAKAAIASNATGTVQINGVWSFQRADTNLVAAGAALYYSSATSVTATAASDKYIGQCTEAVTACLDLTNSVGEVDSFIKVDLNVPQRQCIVGTDVQAYDADLSTLAGGLTSNKVWVGQAANNPVAVTLSSGITITTGGVATVAAVDPTAITTTGTKKAGKVTVVSTLSTTVFDFVSGICTQTITTP